jgi:hypothetical protein
LIDLIVDFITLQICNKYNNISEDMTKYLVLPMLAVLGSVVLVSFFSSTSSSAETYNHTEEYMQQHDGGDRAEYLQK